MANTDTLVEQIKEWAATRSDEIVSVPTTGYYSYDIVVDAYVKGKGDGHEIGKEEGQNMVKEMIRKKYYNNARLTADALTIMLKTLLEKGFKPNKFFVNNSIDGASVLFAVPYEVHINDDFLDVAYSEASNLKLQFFDKGLNLQIAFLSDSEKLNISLIKSDGFGLAFDLEKNIPIE